MEIRTSMVKSCLIYLQYYEWYSLVQMPLKQFLYEFVLLMHCKQTWWVCFHHKHFLTRNSLTLRPQEILVLSSINESEHMHHWSMLVLYLASIVVSSVVSLFVLSCSCQLPLEENPMPSEFQLYVSPFPVEKTTTFVLGIPKRPVVEVWIFSEIDQWLCVGTHYACHAGFHTKFWRQSFEDSNAKENVCNGNKVCKSFLQRLNSALR